MAARLMARTVRGIEDVVADEVRSFGRVLGVGRREVWFTASDPVDLRTADDVFLVGAVISGVGRTRASLGVLAAARSAAAVAGLRSRFGGPSGFVGVDVSASFLGRRNFTRYDVEDAVGVPLASALGVPYFSRRDGVPPVGGLSWRVTVEDDRAVVALRIGARPSHRRAYRQVTRPGSLHPPLAAALVRLARPSPGAVVLDPCCGVGTIPIEAATSWPGLTVLGTDHDPAAVSAAATNSAHAGLDGHALLDRHGASTDGARDGDTRGRAGRTSAAGDSSAGARVCRPSARVGWAVADAGRLPIASGSVDLVISNPPWDRQVPPAGVLVDDAGWFWREVRRVLRPGGRAVVVLPDAGPTGLALTGRRTISLFGSHPEVVEFTR